MKLTKLLALLLAVVFAVGLLAACEKSPEDLVADAEEALLEEAYSVDVEMKFTTDNAELNAVLAYMQGMDMEMTVDGENQLISIEMEVMGMDMDAELTVIGQTVYMNMTMEYEGETKTTKQKVTVTEDQLEELLGEATATADITSFEFGSMEVEKVDGKYIVTCTDVSSQSLDDLKEILSSSLGEDGSMALDNIKLIHEIEKGRYDKSTLTCDYVMEVMDQEFTIGIAIEMDFDFDEKIDVKAPADADEYEEVDFDEFM